MSKNYIFLAFSCLFLVACQPQVAIENNLKTEDKPISEDPSANVFVVEGKALLFLRPDSLTAAKAIDALIQEYGEDALAEIGSDEGFYNAEAQDFAQSKGLKTLNTDADMVWFKKSDGSIFKLNNKPQGIGSDVYMFDGQKDPQKIESVASFSDGKEYNKYFGQ